VVCRIGGKSGFEPGVKKERLMVKVVMMKKSSLAQRAAAGQVQARHHNVSLPASLSSAVPCPTSARRSRMSPLVVNYGPPDVI